MAKGKMTRCTECGKPFAAAVKNCPYCGAKNPLKKSPLPKIILSVLGLFLIIGIVGMMLGGDNDSGGAKKAENVEIDQKQSENDDSGNSSEDDKTGNSSQQPVSTDNPASLSIGDTVRFGDWIINVTGFEFLSAIQSSEYTSFTPEDGCQYAVVYLTITNDGKEADQFLPSLNITGDVFAKIYYKNEYEYSASNLLGYDKDLHDVYLNPLTSKSGSIAFEVPDLVATGTESLSITFSDGIHDDVSFALRG